MATISVVFASGSYIKFKNVNSNVVQTVIYMLSKPLTSHKFMKVSGHHLLPGSVHLFGFLLEPVPHCLDMVCRVPRCVNDFNLVVDCNVIVRLVHGLTAEFRRFTAQINNQQF